MLGRLLLIGKEPDISTGTHPQQDVKMTLKPCLRSEKGNCPAEQWLAVNQVREVDDPLIGWYEIHLILLVLTFFLSFLFLY